MGARLSYRAHMDSRNPSRQDDKSNAADRNGGEGGRERRSGEGSESALANLKRIERDRERTRPAEERGSARR